MNKPFIIYSDFDGVYNIPESPLTVTAKVFTKNSEFLARKKKISWNPDSVGLLSQLLDTDLFNFIWHSTWNDAGNIQHAAEVMGLEGLDKYSDSNLNKLARNRREWTRWKAEKIIADQSVNSVPFIWIDDNAPAYWEDYVKGHVRAPSLIIKPNSKTGISKSDYKRIVEWSMDQMAKTAA